MKITINVTQEDIDHGVPMMKCGCPIARACRRRFNLNPEDIFVSRYELRLFLNNETFPTKVELPLKAQAFISNFDAEIEVSPFSFEIDLGVKKEF